MLGFINPDNSCSFTGYRPEKLPWGDDESAPRCEILKENLICTVLQAIQLGKQHFLCGMARGSDLYFCEAVIFLRKRYPGITIEAAIPHKAQAIKWHTQEQERYNQLKNQCDLLTFVSDEYSSSCMMRRNRYMVKNSSLLISVYDGKPGGTHNTVKYARKRGLEIIEIVP